MRMLWSAPRVWRANPYAIVGTSRQRPWVGDCPCKCGRRPLPDHRLVDYRTIDFVPARFSVADRITTFLHAFQADQRDGGVAS